MERATKMFKSNLFGDLNPCACIVAYLILVLEPYRANFISKIYLCSFNVPNTF